MTDTPDDPDGTRVFRPEDEADDGGPGDELVGTVFAGRYRILRCLGKGAMGAVYEAEHLKIGRRDAIKVLQGSIARDPEATRRFLRGARNASVVRHPNVCAIYDFGETPDGLQFLAMEFVKGQSLTDLIRSQGRLPPRRAVYIARQIAAALQAAHDQEVVHRDLKPDNVMLAEARDGSDLVKVVDFDIARGAQEGEGMSVTRTGFVVGTPEYMSPEQLTGDQLDGRSDLYSLGLVLFRMLSGELPFKGDTAQELMVQRLTTEPLSLADVAGDHPFPDGMQEILDRVLKRKPGERFPDAEAFSNALAKVVGLPPSPRGPLTGPGPLSGKGTQEGLDPDATRVAPASATVPPTRVSDESASDPGPETAMEPPATRVGPSGPAGRRSLWVAAVALLVLVVGVGGGALLLVNRGADEVPEVAALDPGEQEDPADGPATDTDEAPDPGQTGDEGADPSPTTGEADAESIQEGTQPRETPAPADPQPVDAGDEGLQLPDRDPRSVLDAQFGRLDETDRASLLAIRDTTQAIWERAPMSRADSAHAAFILGSTLIPLGDSIRGVQWLDEAVRLNPLRGYVTLRDLHRDGSP